MNVPHVNVHTGDPRRRARPWPSRPAQLLLGRRRPMSVPPIIWRRLRLVRVLVTLLLAAKLLGALAVFDMAFTIARAMPIRVGKFAALAPWFVLAFPGEWMLLRVARRKVRTLAVQAVRDGIATCPNCGYGLLLRSEDCRCPECGQPYDPATLEQLWRGWAVQ